MLLVSREPLFLPYHLICHFLFGCPTPDDWDIWKGLHHFTCHQNKHKYSHHHMCMTLAQFSCSEDSDLIYRRNLRPNTLENNATFTGIKLHSKALTMMTVAPQLLPSYWIGWGRTLPFHFMSNPSILPGHIPLILRYSLNVIYDGGYLNFVLTFFIIIQSQKITYYL